MKNELLTVLTAWFCLGTACQYTKTQVNSGDSTLKDVAIPQVETVVCRMQPFLQYLKCEGLVKPAREQVWRAETAGMVKSFNGVDGQHYRKMQTIAVLDGSMLELKLERSLLTRYSADQDYQSQLLGYEGLLKDQPAGRVDSISKKLRISSGLALAEQDIIETKTLLNKTRLQAGFDGRLADVHIKSGSQFDAGEVLFKLYSDQDLYMETEVLETDLPMLKIGLAAQVYTLSDTMHPFGAELSTINPYVNEKGMARIQLRIGMGSAAPTPLYPGMHCYAVITIATANSIVIPNTALVVRDQKPVVFTVADGTAKWNDVVLGGDNGKEVQILKGLADGDQVIISNNTQLAHHSPVQVAAP